MRGFRRSVIATVCGCAIAVLAALPAHAEPKVVVLGFDGADARLVEQWMDEGELPNLAAIRDEGTFRPLRPTNPAQTPVSWSAFATGNRPGKTEIFDFLKRDPETYIPDFALMTPGKKELLFGEKNGLAFGIFAGIAAAVIGLLLTLMLKLPWAARAGIAVVIGLAAGIPLGMAAQRNLPVEVPDAVNNRKGDTFWKLAADAGLDVQVVRVPTTFPADDVGSGNMVSGLGVPDMRARVGTPAFYTSDPTFRPGDNEFSLELVPLPARRGKIETRVIGPLNQPFYDFVVERETAAIEDSKERAKESRRIRERLDRDGIERRIDLPLSLEVTDTTLTFTVGGETRTLAVGEWSDWITLDFPVNGWVDRLSPLKGMTRFKLLSLSPEVQFYHGPINFHPDCHPIAFAWPPDFSETLAERFGLYKTIGWAIDTWSPSSEIGGDDLVLEDAWFTLEKYQEIMEGLLADGDADLFVQVFYFTDRLGHIFWRHIDPGHPLHDAVEAKKYGPELLRAYKKMDEIVGKARELAPDAKFIICSDHGFSSFRRGLNINTWLAENGLLAFRQAAGDRKATVGELFDGGGGLGTNIDWENTKAYALGLGAVYVNVLGREARGSVLPGADYREVVRQIKEGLEAYVDPVTGRKPVSRVWTRDEMYGEEYDGALIPDLRVANTLDFRVSWQTTLLGGGDTIVEDNTKVWSGDHCSNEPDLVRGIFFSDFPIDTDDPKMVDLMPTILELLELPVPEGIDGTSLVGGA